MSDHPTQSRPAQAPAALTIGLATAVAMWLAGFLTHLPGLRADPPVVGVTLLTLQLAGGFLAGRMLGRSTALRTTAALGAAAGAVAALVNLLVLGSYIADDQTGAASPSAGLAAAGFILFAALLGSAAAALGSHTRPEPHPLAHAEPARWVGLLALVAVAAALPVLLTGGLVTSKDAGLTVPDWPGSFQANMFLLPISRMTGGIYYEHAHRLFGALVGLTTLTLLAATLLWARRRPTLVLVGLAFLLVLAQGILGGVRVLLGGDADGVAAIEHIPDAVALDYRIEQDTPAGRSFALVHGVFGQLTIGWLCITAAVLSRSWLTRCDIPRPVRDAPLALCSAALLASLVAQLVLGAATRHFESVLTLGLHLAFATVVTILACYAGARALRYRGTVPALLGGFLLAAVIAQVTLGFLTTLAVLPYGRPGADPVAAALTATAHQTTGAALLGAGAALTAWAYRLTARPRGADQPATTATTPLPVAPAH